MNFGAHGGSCGHSCCLRIQDLTVTINGNAIVDKVNLHLHCGEIVALIGPNGAGKSTFINLVMKLSILTMEKYYSMGSIWQTMMRLRSKKFWVLYCRKATFSAEQYLIISDIPIRMRINSIAATLFNLTVKPHSS